MISFRVTLAAWASGRKPATGSKAQIIELGRRHLVTEGAAGLSLRAIARDLGMVSSAVYRYVASRDDLLTLLLVDAYSELADAVDRARAAAGGSWRDQLLAMARAARQWAVDQPASWALLYGSPVPGYHAPRERTVGPGTRVVGALFDAIAAGIAAGDIPSDQCCCGTTVVVGLRPTAGGVRLSPATTPRWPSAFCCGRDWSGRSASRCSASTAPTR